MNRLLLPPRSLSVVRPEEPGLKVLLIEDNLGDAILLHSALRKAFPRRQLEVSHCQTLALASQLLSEREFDLITADLHLPDSLDLDAVMTAKRLAPTTPLIVVSAWSDREAAVRSLQVGAQDYLIKGRLSSDTLRWSIESAIEREQSRSRMEARLKQEMERNKTKDDVLGMTAHDIRGPLIGVLAYLNSILKGQFLSHLSPEQKRVFGLMASNCEQVLSLTDEIVHAKKRSFQMFHPRRELISLRPFVTEFLTELEGRAMEKKIKIDVDFQGSPRVFFLDPQLIKRAIGNLVQNAISASPPHTEIHVQVARCELGLTISVTDQGPGVPADLQPTLFADKENISQEDLRKASKGLGLVIVRRIAEAHGGRAWLDHSSPKGSKFCFEISPIDS